MQQALPKPTVVCSSGPAEHKYGDSRDLSKPTFAEMVFYSEKKNSDLLFKKIAVLIKKTFENSRLKAKFFFGSQEQFIRRIRALFEPEFFLNFLL